MNLKEVLQQSDPEIAKYVNSELNRQREKLELIASENIVCSRISMPKAIPANVIMAAVNSWMK